MRVITVELDDELFALLVLEKPVPLAGALMPGPTDDEFAARVVTELVSRSALQSKLRADSRGRMKAAAQFFAGKVVKAAVVPFVPVEVIHVAEPAVAPVVVEDPVAVDTSSAAGFSPPLDAVELTAPAESAAADEPAVDHGIPSRNILGRRIERKRHADKP